MWMPVSHWISASKAKFHTPLCSHQKETIKQTENRCKHCGTPLVDLPQQWCSVIALVSKHLCMGCSKISHQPSAPKGCQGRQNFHFNGSMLLGNTRGYVYSSMKDVLLLWLIGTHQSLTIKCQVFTIPGEKSLILHYISNMLHLKIKRIQALWRALHRDCTTILFSSFSH